MEKAERKLLQGWGGYIVFLDEKDQEEYENVEEETQIEVTFNR